MRDRRFFTFVAVSGASRGTRVGTVLALVLGVLGIVLGLTLAVTLPSGEAAGESVSNPLPGLTFPAECSRWASSSTATRAPDRPVRTVTGGVARTKVTMVRRRTARVRLSRTFTIRTTLTWTTKATFDACGNGYGIHDPYAVTRTVPLTDTTRVTLTAIATAHRTGPAHARKAASARARAQLRAQRRLAAAVATKAAVSATRARARAQAVAVAKSRALAGATFPRPTTDQIATDLITDTNLVRTAAGRPTLRTMTVLTNFAQSWTDHLAATMRWNDFASGSDAHSVGTVDDFPSLVQCSPDTDGLPIGENIAGFGSDAAAQYLHPAAMAQYIAVAATRAWLTSPGHFATLTEPSYNRTGMGVSATRDGALFIAQEFADDTAGTCSRLP